MELPSVQGSWQKKGLPAWPRALQAEDLAVLDWGKFPSSSSPFPESIENTGFPFATSLWGTHNACAGGLVPCSAQ